MAKKTNFVEERETDEQTGKVYVKRIETRRFEEKNVNLPFGITLTRKVEVKEEAEPAAEGDEQQPAEDKKKKKGFWRKLGIGLLAGGAVAVGGKAIYDRAHQDEDDEDEEYDEYDEYEDEDEEEDDEEEDDE